MMWQRREAKTSREERREARRRRQHRRGSDDRRGEARREEVSGSERWCEQRPLGDERDEARRTERRGEKSARRERAAARRWAAGTREQTCCSLYTITIYDNDTVRIYTITSRICTIQRWWNWLALYSRVSVWCKLKTFSNQQFEYEQYTCSCVNREDNSLITIETIIIKDTVF